MRKFITALVVPLVMVVLSVPLILDKVPPNKIYGFRTPKALASPEIWYSANRAAGWFLLAAAITTIGLNWASRWIRPEGPMNRGPWWMMGGGILIPVTIAVVASFIYVGRL